MFFKKKFVVCEIDLNVLNCSSFSDLERYCSKIQDDKFPIRVHNILKSAGRGNSVTAYIPVKSYKKIQKDKDSPIKILTVLEEGLTEKEVMSHLMG
jgi:hypothetical protein